MQDLNPLRADLNLVVARSHRAVDRARSAMAVAHENLVAASARQAAVAVNGERPRTASVDVYDEHDLHVWSEKFGVTRVEILSAIVAVGTCVDRLHAYFEAAKQRRQRRLNSSADG